QRLVHQVPSWLIKSRNAGILARTSDEGTIRGPRIVRSEPEGLKGPDDRVKVVVARDDPTAFGLGQGRSVCARQADAAGLRRVAKDGPATPEQRATRPYSAIDR